MAGLGGVLPTLVGDEGIVGEEALADRRDFWVDRTLGCFGQ